MKRFSVEQIVPVLKEQVLEIRGTELCRRIGMSANTFFRWKRLYVRPAPRLEESPPKPGTEKRSPAERRSLQRWPRP